jgi:ATP-dependent helicase HrpB
VRSVCTLEFDPERERVIERRQQLFHDLVLTERVDFNVDGDRAGEILAAIARRAPTRVVDMTEAAGSLLERIRFLQSAMPELNLPADRDALLTNAVAELCAGQRSFADVRRADAGAALRRQLTPHQLHTLDREAPTQYRLPSGRTVAVRYEADKPPSVAARIQELFGLTATPRLAGGRVPLVIQLLAPNQRPVQITDDLASFWRTTYPEVRRQLRGRYPKHAWPEDPWNATPTARTKRR